MIDRISGFALALIVGTMLVVVPIIGGLFYPEFLPGYGTGSYERSSTQTQTLFTYPSSVSGVYAQLGYPKISGNADHAPPGNDLTRAVRLAMIYGGLSPSNYTLITADLEGSTWGLWFAQTYDGFWLLGQGSYEASSYYAEVDASPNVLRAFTFPTYQPLTGRYALVVSATQALAAVRGLGASLSFPPSLTRDGSVEWQSPRIIKFDSQANLPLQHAIDPQVNGKSRLCWVISLRYDSNNYAGGWQGAFAVDALTGQLVSGWDQMLFPSSPGPFFTSSTTSVSSKGNNTVTSTIAGP